MTMKKATKCKYKVITLSQREAHEKVIHCKYTKNCISEDACSTCKIYENTKKYIKS